MRAVCRMTPCVLLSSITYRWEHSWRHWPQHSGGLRGYQHLASTSGRVCFTFPCAVCRGEVRCSAVHMGFGSKLGLAGGNNKDRTQQASPPVVCCVPDLTECPHGTCLWKQGGGAAPVRACVSSPRGGSALCIPKCRITSSPIGRCAVPGRRTWEISRQSA